MILAALVLGLFGVISPAFGEILVGDNVTFLTFDGAGERGLNNGTVLDISGDGDWLLIYIPPNHVTVVPKWSIYSDETMANQLLTKLLMSVETQEPKGGNYETDYEANDEEYKLGEPQTQPPEQVALTIYVHEGDMNGTMLSGVTIIGADAAGNIFDGVTDSNGIVTITGQPGTWQFTFVKEGYETVNLYYDVTETGEANAYLKKINQPMEQQQTSEDQTLASQM